ncbi:MAG: Creatininase [Candidatus Uhrbacteria bacterium GW2011_GWD1_41_16]|nr:MAG: Creatininase [Candidatus Uhrbacteria bacterium GW2011_GWD1_41_16]KKS17959.1 MAG: Creatininase [Candidatus Uhrbacteria bacterium GW2011_GWB1_41_7]HAL50498.1 hypothetical protein [Candidatus Uhrbacteria bacterium]HAN06643.1 hypothetical protein [Candidatus Uhrbacteria bacterium]HAP65577.1 hypothetical protein [Candidatus Uhrbacteria bacterium]
MRTSHNTKYLAQEFCLIRFLIKERKTFSTQICFRFTPANFRYSETLYEIFENFLPTNRNIMRLKRMKHPELSSEQKHNFVLPIGSTEQHGLFAPFGTDTYITDYLVNQVEKQFPELVILPTLEFSRSREHRGFFGTIYLTEETLEKVIFDICNSIYKKANIIFIA